MIVDLFLLYSFVKRLATPFKRWKAFDQGIIDSSGNVLIPRAELNTDQKKVFGLFDLMILNLKRLIAKVPGGGTQLATFAAALWLLKESENEPTEADLEQILSRMETEHTNLHEALQMNGTLLLEDEGGVPTNNTTNIAGKDGPVLARVKRNKAKKGEVGDIVQ